MHPLTHGLTARQMGDWGGDLKGGGGEGGLDIIPPPPFKERRAGKLVKSAMANYVSEKSGIARMATLKRANKQRPRDKEKKHVHCPPLRGSLLLFSHYGT